MQRKVTKKGDTWVLTQLEDLGGSIEVMIFPSAYQLCATILAEDAIVFVKGRIDKREDVAKIIAMEVTQPDLTVESGGPLVVSLAMARVTPPVVGRLKEVLDHPPRHDRGAPPGPQRPPHDRDAPRRPPAGDPEPGPDGRPQTAPRAGLPGSVALRCVRLTLDSPVQTEQGVTA